MDLQLTTDERRHSSPLDCDADQSNCDIDELCFRHQQLYYLIVYGVVALYRAIARLDSGRGESTMLLNEEKPWLYRSGQFED